MKISILTLFPDMFDALKHSMLGRALDNNLFELDIVNIRDYTLDKHKRCDDYPFGGGAGMVMQAQPIHDAIIACDPEHRATRIYLSPKGQVLSQGSVEGLAKRGDILLLCGHYEGVDQRVLDMDIDMEISIGDYVLSGGELPAMVLVDSIARYIPEVLGNSETTHEESFADGLLEYPQYTRPQTWQGVAVPEVLTSGNHQLIRQWRQEQSVAITKARRPDLIEE